MRRRTAILVALLLAAPVTADDVVWRPAAPLAMSRTADGRVIGASPEPTWTSDRALATLQNPRPAPLGTPRPRELPGTLTEPQGPRLPPLPGFASETHVSPPPGRAGFAGKPAIVIPPPTEHGPRPKDVPAARLAVPRP